ncbi:MAG: protein translocase subunit SecF [Candidatus Eiseniibacteriota bacterium]
MFQILHDTKIPFMSYRRIMYFVSAAVVLVTVAWLVINRGPRYSVDFTGGTLLQVQTTGVLQADDVREALEHAGFQGLELQQAGQGDEWMIRLPQPAGQDTLVSPYPKVRAALLEQFPNSNPELRREEAVGPRVGEELRSKAFWAILFSLGGILLYVGIRYEFKFALGAVVALFHDIFAAFGVMLFLNREISLTVIAALLTLAGYSINDTIVVFDRIRERGKQLHKLSHEEMMNTAINETLSRTVITSITVFLATLALYIFGGEVINDFALCILAGVVFGTYSSIFVASALALDIWNWLDRKKGVSRAKAA